MLNIYFENDRRNFADWTKEKVYKAIYNLLLFLDENKSLKDNQFLNYSVEYLLSVYFYLNGKIDNYSYNSFIVTFIKKKGARAMEIMEDYFQNGINGSKVEKIKSNIYSRQVYNKLKELINENSKINIKKIEEYIAYLLHYNDVFYDMYYMIDEVLVGVIKWEDFYNKYSKFEFELKDEILENEKEYIQFLDKLKEL